MAEAAEQTADWTYGQVLATSIEALLLAIAIGIASWAGYWARRAAIAGDEAVKITRIATGDARKSAERQLRAYVFMEAAQISNFTLGEKIQILFVAKNFGQTPADRVNYWTETYFSGGESNKPPIRQSRSGGDWGPGASVQIVLTREDIWGQDADAIAVVSGVKTMWIYGEIHYSDKFGGDQTTTFRYSYQGNGVMPPEKVLKLYYTPGGNNAT